MAKARLTGFDELEHFLGKLAQPERMAIKAVDKAAPVLENALKSEISRAADRTDKNGRKYSTGQLAGSIKATKAKENHLGVYSVIKPEGKDSKGMRNAEKLAYLEYGVASHGQEPRPVRQRAVKKSRDECEAIMRETVYAEVDKL